MDPPEPRQSGRKRKVNSLLFGNGMIPLEDEHRSRRKNPSKNDTDNVDENLDTVTPPNNENSAQPRKKTASKDQPRYRKNQSSKVESEVSQQLADQVTPDVVPDLISVNPENIAQSQTVTVEPEIPVNVIKLVLKNV